MRYLGRAKPRDNEFNFMTMDIETDSRNGSALLGEPVFVSWCIDGIGYGEPCTDLTDWLFRFLIPEYEDYLIYCHNGFGFDYKRLDWSRIAEEGFTANFLTGKDGSIKSVTFKRDDIKWYLRDSLLLIPESLASVTKTFAPDNQKLVREIGFDEKPFDPFDDFDRDYAIQDSVGLYIALENMDSILRKIFNVTIHSAATLPGLAFKAFRLGMDEGEKYPGISFQTAHASRESYHGGQTIAFQTGKFRDVVSIDANSMYPFVMLNWNLPTGKCNHILGFRENANPDRTLCLAIVNIPNGVFPILKTQNENNRTGNFNGTVTGWYWLFELEYQKHLGATFEIIESYEWEDSTNVAKRFSDKCRTLRMQDYHGPLGRVAKLLNNALYGKFAQQASEFGLMLSLDMPELEAVPMYDPVLGEIIPSLWQIPNPPSFRADMTHWASFITSKSRVVLTEAIERIGFENVIYCDTDSIFCPRECLDSVQDILGTEYGQFKIEKGTVEKGIEFQAVAPKAYKYIEADGKIIVRNKGIPKRELAAQDGYNRLGEENQKIEFIQSNNLFQMLKRGKDYGRMATRRMATANSTTNGKSINNVWMPTPCHVRDISSLRGVETSGYLSIVYSKILDRFMNETIGGTHYAG